MANGSLDTARGAKTRRVLEEISRRDGMTLSEIQRFICEMNGVDYDARDGLGRRRSRGYWCVMLYGGGIRWCVENALPFRTKAHKRQGLLSRYCVKDGRRWRLKP